MTSSSPISPARRAPRAVALGAAALSLTLLAGCSTGPSGGASTSPTADGSETSAAGEAPEFPRSIEHAYGTTEIPEQPERVATVSWVNQDVSLALGVVPVGMAAVEFGGNAEQSTDWFDAALSENGGTAPEKYSEADGIDFEAIAALEPDVILAAYSGLTQEDYSKLSEIAPVVAYPKDVPAFGTSWQDSTRLIGQALGKDAEAEAVVEDVEQQVAQAAQENPALQDTTFLYGTLDPAAADQIYLYTDVDNRPKFLESLGMSEAPVMAEQDAKGQFFITWSPERADELDSDVFVSWAAEESVGETIAADPLLGSIPAVQDETLVLQTDEQETLSVSAASPLSIPWALDNVLPDIAAAAEKADETSE